MVQINFAQRAVNAKIVYYGPGMSGKTTNLEVIHQRAPEGNRGDLTSISTDGDRTLFFDFMPLDLGTVAGMRTCFQIYTVPGQVYYNSTRKLVLQGVDGVVFVADSSASMQEENLESMRNLQENLAEYGRSLDELPLVIQYNKRDLPDALEVEQLEELLNPFGAPSFEGVANTGQGVFPTLKALAACVIEHIHKQQRGASDGGASSSAPPPGMGQTAPPPARPQPMAAPQPRAPLPAPASQQAEAGHEAPAPSLAAARVQPTEHAPQAPAQAAGDLRLARPMTRTNEPVKTGARPVQPRPAAAPVQSVKPAQPQAPAPQPQPRLQSQQRPGPAPATRQSRPARGPGVPMPGGSHRLQPDPGELAPPSRRGRGSSAQTRAPRPDPRSTPAVEPTGGRSAAMTALIVGGSVVAGAVIGSVVLSLL